MLHYKRCYFSSGDQTFIFDNHLWKKSSLETVGKSVCQMSPDDNIVVCLKSWWKGSKRAERQVFSPSLSFPHFLFDVTAIHPLRLIQKNWNMFKISFTLWIWREMGLHSTLVCSVLAKIWIYLLPSRVKWKVGNCSGFRQKNFKAFKDKTAYS